MSPNTAASIKARLLVRAKRDHEEFDLYLVRYVCERFLYRLGASPFHDRCILKGAGLLALWMDDPYRATRDVDLLASGGSDAASVREAMETICAVPCPEDGVVFDLDSLAVLSIRNEMKYTGQRGFACRLISALVMPSRPVRRRPSSPYSSPAFPRHNCAPTLVS